MAPRHKRVSSVILSGGSERLSDPRSHSGEGHWARLGQRAKVKGQERGAPGVQGVGGPRDLRGGFTQPVGAGSLLAREAGDAGDWQ